MMGIFLKKDCRISKAKQILTLSTLFVVCILVFSGCSKKKQVVSESIADIQKREGIPVRVTNVNPGSIEAIVVAGGTAEGYYQAIVTSSVAGRIVDLKIKIGDVVSKGASLMTIEPDNVSQMLPNYVLAKKQYENAEKSRERIKALADQGGVAQETIDQVEAGYIAAKEGLETARKNEYVLAPFDGTVVDLQQTVNTPVDRGKALVTVAKLDKIRIVLTVSEVEINKYKPNQVAYAIVGSDTVKGAIEKVSLAGQAWSHSFTVEAIFSNPKKILRPGMYIPVHVVVNKKNDVITLGVEDVISEGKTKYVYVVKDGLAHRTLVNTGIRGKDKYEILQGVTTGNMVVTSGAGNLADGLKVKIVQ